MERHILPITAFVLLGAIMTFACRQRDNATSRETTEEITSDELQRKADDAMDAASDMAARERDEFIAATQEQVDALDEQVESLQADAESLGDALTEEAKNRLAALEAEHATLERKMSEIRTATRTSWPSLKQAVTESIALVEASLNDARQSIDATQRDTERVPTGTASAGK